ncbi:MAG: 50S ribosomal protein L3 [Candidatus Micrarchaeota archaeon]
MGKKGPKHGSRAYWHRKRAPKLAPRIRAWPTEGKGLAGFAGYKAGMTSVSMVEDADTPFKGQEIIAPATVLEVPPMYVYSIVAYANTPYGLKAVGEAVATGGPKQLSRAVTAGKKPKVTLEQLLQKQGIASLRAIAFPQPWRTGLGKKTPEPMEIALCGTLQEQSEFAKATLGKEVSARDVFKAGDFVDAIAVTTGRGWQGVVKRMGVSLNNRKATGVRRHGGSIGGERQAKVMYTIPRAGQHGFHRRTDRHKRILAITEGKALAKEFGGYGRAKTDVLFLKGSVPGPRNRLIRLRKNSTSGEPQVKIQG